MSVEKMCGNQSNTYWDNSVWTDWIIIYPTIWKIKKKKKQFYICTVHLNKTINCSIVLFMYLSFDSSVTFVMLRHCMTLSIQSSCTINVVQDNAYKWDLFKLWVCWLFKLKYEASQTKHNQFFFFQHDESVTNWFQSGRSLGSLHRLCYACQLWLPLQ